MTLCATLCPAGGGQTSWHSPSSRISCPIEHFDFLSSSFCHNSKMTVRVFTVRSNREDTMVTLLVYFSQIMPRQLSLQVCFRQAAAGNYTYATPMKDSRYRSRGPRGLKPPLGSLQRGRTTRQSSIAINVHLRQ
jgi:hypothetical protein